MSAFIFDAGPLGSVVQNCTLIVLLLAPGEALQVLVRC